MRKSLRILFSILALIAFARPSSALMKMDDSAIEEAIAFGESYTIEEIANSPEWTVKEKDGTEAAFITPYNFVAISAAKAKMNGKIITFQKVKALFRPAEAGTLGMADLFLFYCWVYGPTVDYLKKFTFELQQGATAVKLAESEMEQPTLVQKNGKKLYYTHYRLYFSNVRIDTKLPLELVVMNSLGKEWRYKFDLADMR